MPLYGPWRLSATPLEHASLQIPTLSTRSSRSSRMEETAHENQPYVPSNGAAALAQPAWTDPFEWPGLNAF